MIDFHIHPSYSIDSGVGIDEIIETAMSRGLEAICFTTHIDLNPDRRCLDNYIRCGGRLMRYSDETIKTYITDIRERAEEHSGRIKILMGFELSYGNHFVESIQQFLETYHPDFALGAVHCLDNIAITSRGEATGYFRATSLDKAMGEFVLATEQLVKSRLFKTVAHIDGIKKYGRAFYGETLNRELERLLPPVFARMAELDVGIEINTASLRKGHPDLYPSERLLESARDAGVTVNSVGSDAHEAAEVGFELERAYELIERIGIEIGEPLASYVS